MLKNNLEIYLILKIQFLKKYSQKTIQLLIKILLKVLENVFLVLLA